MRSIPWCQTSRGRRICAAPFNHLYPHRCRPVPTPSCCRQHKCHLAPASSCCLQHRCRRGPVSIHCPLHKSRQGPASIHCHQHRCHPGLASMRSYQHASWCAGIHTGPAAAKPPAGYWPAFICQTLQLISEPQHSGDLILPSQSGHCAICTDDPSLSCNDASTSGVLHFAQLVVTAMPHLAHSYLAIIAS